MALNGRGGHPSLLCLTDSISLANSECTDGSTQVAQVAMATQLGPVAVATCRTAGGFALCLSCAQLFSVHIGSHSHGSRFIDSTCCATPSQWQARQVQI